MVGGRETTPLVVADSCSTNKQRLVAAGKSCRDQIPILGLTAEAETQDRGVGPLRGAELRQGFHA
jgi:hypothetical protein